jgi:hypothetical protein
MIQTVPLSDLICEDLYVSSVPSNVRVYLRNKRLPLGAAGGKQTVTIFVHGATFSGVSAFDPPFRGGSWLDFAATHGHDAYAMDVRGYGLSSRPNAGAEGAWGEAPLPHRGSDPQPQCRGRFCFGSNRRGMCKSGWLVVGHGHLRRIRVTEQFEGATACNVRPSVDDGASAGDSIAPVAGCQDVDASARTAIRAYALLVSECYLRRDTSPLVSRIRRNDCGAMHAASRI